MTFTPIYPREMSITPNSVIGFISRVACEPSPKTNWIAKTEMRDRFLFWPIPCTIAGPVAVILAQASLSDRVAALLILGAWSCFALVALAIGIDGLLYGAWRRFVSLSVVPLTMAVMLLNFDRVWFATVDAGNLLDRWFYGQTFDVRELVPSEFQH